MPKPKKRTSRPQPSRMSSVQSREPLLIRQDYGYRDNRPGAVSSIAEFDMDRRRNPNPNPIIREANRRYSAMDKGLKYEQGGEVKGRFPSNRLGERMYGQETSEIRSDDKGTFVWYAGDADGLPSNSSDQEWKDKGAVKVYGDFSKYSNSRSRFLHDEHDYIIRPTGDGSYELDEEQTQAQAGMEKAEYMAEEARGGMGASPTEDLLERLNQYKRNAYGNKYEQGGEVKEGTKKVAGQYAVGPIKTTPEGNQYVSMDLGDGRVVPVFGDWHTYGNPTRDNLIEDLDYRIYPLGDGTWALDAAEAEADMLRAEAMDVARDTQAGPGASRMQDLLEKLSDRPGMGIDPKGRMRPVKKQR